MLRVLDVCVLLLYRNDRANEVMIMTLIITMIIVIYFSSWGSNYAGSLSERLSLRFFCLLLLVYQPDYFCITDGLVLYYTNATI